MKLTFGNRDAALETPESLDENIYDPNLSDSNSLEAINGHLDFRNVNYAALPTDHLPLQAIRRGALFRGKMVGATLNADYYKKAFNYNDKSSSGNDTHHLQPIPGAGIEFYAPTGGQVLLTWQVSYSSDLEDHTRKEIFAAAEGEDLPEVPDYEQRAFVTLMSASGNDFDLSEIGRRHFFPSAIRLDETDFKYDARWAGRERTWSGHYLATVSSQTWYRYGIGVYSTANLSRIRVRNFKYLLFPNTIATVTEPVPVDIV